MTGPAPYRALLIAADLLAYLQSKGACRLQVHSVFQTSVNLLGEDGGLVTFATRDRDLMPMGLIVDLDRISLWGLKPGDRVQVEPGLSFTLSRQAGSLLAAQAEVGSVSLGRLSDHGAGDDLPALSLIRDRLSASDTVGIASLVDGLSASGGKDSFGNSYCAYIQPALESFLDCLGAGDYEGALQESGSLIGFGPGLTPACDDFLAGIMLDHFYRGGDQAFLDGLVVRAQDRTSLVSYHMLKKAAEGRADTAWLALIEALAGGDPKTLDPLIDRVLAYGASSGSDFLFGLYCGRLIRTSSAQAGRKLF